MNYLSEHTVKSWLMTTDHKRIGLLYLFTILIFFFIASVAAAMMRIELLTPNGDMVTSETYNKLFTIHGVLMVWFFLVPSIPTVLGNFLLPMMIGARDVAFPRLNLISWYIFIGAGAIAFLAIIRGGVDTGWTFYTPYQLDLLEWACARDGGRGLHGGILLHHYRDEFHGDHPQDARAGANVVPAAALLLVALCDQPHHGAGDAGAGNHAGAHVRRAGLGRRHLRSAARRRPGAVPAYVLVLLAPGGLHHDPAGDGCGQRGDYLLFAEAGFWL